MIHGRIESSKNQRTYATVISVLVGVLLILGGIDWNYPLLWRLTAGGLAGLGCIYVGIGLYKKWF